MLKIKNLGVEVEGKAILSGLTMDIGSGQVHALMGPNGSGKSTLSRALIGDEQYSVTQGSIEYLGQNLLEMPVEERAKQGVFLSFQYPVAIPGVSNIQFLKASVNQVRVSQGFEPLDAMDVLEQAKAVFAEVGLDESFISRPVNEGFSGGEKKRNELAQMLLLQPRLVILDEIDSGLDVDALRIVAQCVEKLKATGTAFLIVTHYQRLLDHVNPDKVHILMQGNIHKSGSADLAKQLEQQGYQALA